MTPNPASRLRRWLDRVYFGAALLAAACLAGIAVLVLAQIVGRWFGVAVPSAEEFAGYLLAAATFLALAHALRERAHIRVELVSARLPAAAQGIVEGAVLLIALVFAAWAGWHAAWMVWESWSFGEVASGHVAVPLWLPQLPMALGIAVFALALLDASVVHLFGRRRD
jgi:TRAP-type C4-dicarboxylate transport system permease small subunit